MSTNNELLNKCCSVTLAGGTARKSTPVWRFESGQLKIQIRAGCSLSVYSARMPPRLPRRLRQTAKHRSAMDSATPGRSGRLRESDPLAGLRQQRERIVFWDFHCGCLARQESRGGPIEQVFLPGRKVPPAARQNNRS